MKKNNLPETATRVFNYMKEHKIVGKENGYNRLTLTWLLGLKHDRTLREALNYINEHQEQFKTCVSTCGSIYLCENDDESVLAIGATWKQALGLIRKARCMTEGLKNRNQCRIELPAQDYDALFGTFQRGAQ